MTNDRVQKSQQKRANRSSRWQMIRGPKEANIGSFERWISCISGGLLMTYGLLRRGRMGMAAVLLGGGLICRGVQRYSCLYEALGLNTAGTDHAHQLKVQRAVTVNRSPEEICQCLRNFEQLPKLLPDLKEIIVQDDIHSRWIVQAPGKRSLSWDAEITSEVSDEYIAWRAHSGALFSHHGLVRLTRAPGQRGTEVKVFIAYTRPLGRLGDLAVKPLGLSPDQQIREGLRHLKAFIEAGEIPRACSQSAGR